MDEWHQCLYIVLQGVPEDHWPYIQDDHIMEQCIVGRQERGSLVQRIVVAGAIVTGHIPSGVGPLAGRGGIPLVGRGLAVDPTAGDFPELEAP